MDDYDPADLDVNGKFDLPPEEHAKRSASMCLLGKSELGKFGCY